MASYCIHCGEQLKHLLGSRTVLQGRYEIVQLLGCGGMGAVYLALDTSLGRTPVAIKENHAPQAPAQFHREATVLAQLDHPALPKVSHYFVEPSGREYLVMEYVIGQDLETIVRRRGALREKQVLACAEALLDALSYLHSQLPPVVHRDIKPGNIRITPQGKIKLVDFGLVKHYDPAQPRTSASIHGAGTIEYAPPEQYIGAGHTDPRSDVYALGASLYHLATGQEPQPAVNRMADPSAMLAPRQAQPAMSASLEAVILKAMELDMDRRFQSADEMRRALHGHAPPGRPAAPSGDRLGMLVRLPLWILSLIGMTLLVLVLIATLVIVVWLTSAFLRSGMMFLSF